MEAEAASAGFYEHKTNQQKYPRLQLRTVKELMEGKGIERPSTSPPWTRRSRKPRRPSKKGNTNTICQCDRSARLQAFPTIMDGHIFD